MESALYFWILTRTVPSADSWGRRNISHHGYRVLTTAHVRIASISAEKAVRRIWKIDDRYMQVWVDIINTQVEE